MRECGKQNTDYEKKTQTFSLSHSKSYACGDTKQTTNFKWPYVKNQGQMSIGLQASKQKNKWTNAINVLPPSFAIDNKRHNI